METKIASIKNEEVIDLAEKKMTSGEKKDAAKYAKTPAAKKAKKLKLKCIDKHGDQVKKSNGKLTCDSHGKVVKGMDKATKKAMVKARLKH